MRSVVNMTSMFKSALSFEGNGLEKWDVNNIVYMDELFEEAISFSGTIGSWRTENAVDMSRLFQYATSFTGDLSGWMVERVRMFDYAFNGARLWNRDISGWKIGSALSFVSMVSGSVFALFLLRCSDILHSDVNTVCGSHDVQSGPVQLGTAIRIV